MRQWKQVVGFEGCYEVSNDGLVRSLDRHVECGNGKKRFFTGKELKPGVHYSGHKAVALTRNGKRIFTGIHRLVLSAFIREPNFGEVCRHKDGDCTNNNVENLEWGTCLENAADSIAHGVQPRGDKCGASKLTENEVRLILLYRKQKTKIKQIANMFNVTGVTIKNIIYGKTWKHVTLGVMYG